MTSLGNAPIVVGVDGSPAALEAVRWGARTAARHRAPLELVHAAGFPDLLAGTLVPPHPDLKMLLRKKGLEYLHLASEFAEAAADVDVRTRLDVDTAATALLDASSSARMLVLGASGRSQLSNLITGSVAITLSTRAQCPTVIVRGSGWETSRNLPVVVGIDGSPTSERAIAAAFEEADVRRVPLLAVHAWDDGDNTSIFSDIALHFEWQPVGDAERRLLAQRLAGWCEQYPDVDVEQVVVRDRPRHELLALSHRAQLVVVGSRGRGEIGGLLLGSTSQALVHHSACPVLIARPALPDDDTSRP